MKTEPLLEFESLEIDYSVAPLFPVDEVVSKKAFVIRLDHAVHLALAVDLDAAMRGKDFVGSEPLPYSVAVEMARRLSGRSEVVLYQISERALRVFLQEIGRRAMKVFNKMF